MNQTTLISESPATIRCRQMLELCIAVDETAAAAKAAEQAHCDADEAHRKAVEAYEAAMTADQKSYDPWATDNASKNNFGRVLWDEAAKAFNPLRVQATTQHMLDFEYLERKAIASKTRDELDETVRDLGELIRRVKDEQLLAKTDEHEAPPQKKRGRPKKVKDDTESPQSAATVPCIVCARLIDPTATTPSKLTPDGLQCQRCMGAEDMGMVIFRGPGYEASFRCFSLADGRAIGRAEKSRLGNWPHAGEKTRMPEESTVAHSASLRVGRHLAYDKCVGLSDESMAIEFVPAAPEVAAKKDLFGEEENLTSGPGRD